MYSNKLVVAIKSNGKILRETKDIVHLPFGSEFTVLVKNLDTKRIKFKLEIDGTDVLGTEIIVDANSETEIKRFIRNGNMNEGNAFKFIERTETIENGPRGIKIEDGIVKVEFWGEYKTPQPVYDANYWKGKADGEREERNRGKYGWPYPMNIPLGGPFYGTNGVQDAINGSVLRGISCSTSSAANSMQKIANVTAASTENYAESLNDVGITVPGSKIEQAFKPVYGFIAETISNVIVLRLVGKVADKIVEKAITVDHKPKCSTCGRQNKATSKFCTDCGTSLVLL